MRDVLTLSLLLSAIRLTVPVLLAALGGLVSERAGIVNIALEGHMLMGAFAGVVVADTTGHVGLGILGAVATGAVAGALHGWFSLRLVADQIVVGTAWNLIALGATSALVTPIWGAPGASVRVPTLDTISLPVLPDLTLLDWTAAVLAVAVWLVIGQTPAGLRLRSCGENPHAALAAGVRVLRVRYAAVITSGALAALGGAYLSLVQVGLFNRAMSQGRGFIALAAVIFAKWQAPRVVAACALFGLADAFQFRAQAAGFGLPHELLVALPYVLALAALASFAAWTSAPAAAGKQFQRESPSPCRPLCRPMAEPGVIMQTWPLPRSAPPPLPCPSTTPGGRVGSCSGWRTCAGSDR